MTQFSPQRAFATKPGRSGFVGAGATPTVVVMEERTLIEQMEHHVTRFGLVLVCPGCHNWQLEPEGASAEDINEVLLEHARQCPGLTRIAMENAIPIYPRRE